MFIWIWTFSTNGQAVTKWTTYQKTKKQKNENENVPRASGVAVSPSLGMKEDTEWRRQFSLTLVLKMEASNSMILRQGGNVYPLSAYQGPGLFEAYPGRVNIYTALANQRLRLSL